MDFTQLFMRLTFLADLEHTGHVYRSGLPTKPHSSLHVNSLSVCKPTCEHPLTGANLVYELPSRASYNKTCTFSSGRP